MKFTVLMAAPLCLLAAFAPATVLLNEPFSDADYSAGNFKSYTSNVKDTANVGFAADRKWNSSKTSVVIIHADGLDFGRRISGFHGTGLSAGWNSKDTQGNDGSRGVYRQVADNVIPRSGTFYFRCLARENIGASWRGNLHRRVGFQQVGFDGAGGQNNMYYTVIPSTGPQFMFTPKPVGESGYDATASVLKFHFNNVDATLVDSVEQGVTYLCLAKIEIGAGEDGTDLVSALAVPVDDWDWNGRDELAWMVKRVDTGWKLATTVYYGDKFQLYGAYETGSKAVAFDEVMLATDVLDCVGPWQSGTAIIVK